jgi:hypothetical protein
MHLVHIFRVQAGTDVDLHNGKNGTKILWRELDDEQPFFLFPMRK